ncbi:glycoside hydrolase family 10 protein [Mastigocoleus testarum]|uniref:Glycosyl hydrolase-like 10 domain-containing protein n=1 Tax=Mastigocoleus testarum BC008 TaxID=371196 RepID=A0A0V7ZLT4_9CYAN|nr:family 10 glycosylhydrolase [Mastigocoleus testarum]KST65326.1 hypothetical protein BC008_21255 [Mastigocoleus testarum BC008]KST65620.1 hypothetical protein BC008_21830 [Mastigocoleus testarum BC008]
MTKIAIRGVWLTNTDSSVLSSQETIVEAIEFLAKMGFNVVFPVVWNKAATLYPSKVMQQTFGWEIDSRYQGRDPLAEIVNAAHEVNIKVIPWFEYGFASSYNLNGGKLIQKKPEWGACDCRGNLLKKNGFEWLNTLNPEVQDFILSLILEVVRNYDIDGIQGDDRLPALPCEGGYDSMTVQLYYKQFGTNPPSNPKDKKWLQWRADILTEFLSRLYGEVKSVNSHLLVSMAPNIHHWGFQEYLQDSETWLKKEVVDIIHPQLYRRDFLAYKCAIDKLLAQQFRGQNKLKLAPGILMKVGSYLISSENLIKMIEYNRYCGVLGEVFFFYEGLRKNNDALAKVLYSHGYSETARFPTLSELKDNPVNHSVRKKKINLLKLWENIF